MKNELLQYQNLVNQEQMPKVYRHLLSMMMQLKAFLKKQGADDAGFTYGNVSPGYMDYTYFPFYNEDLRAQQLRFGVVFHHANMDIELWLMGQNAEVQTKYWAMFKHTAWNEGVDSMPPYSVLTKRLLHYLDHSDDSSLFDTCALLIKQETEAILAYLRDQTASL
ncbi:MAG: hypothetical protein KA346_09180 [Neisseriaceae bacterium]|nr:hypothetical protein [Neisseriaceae bacterium]